MRRLILLLELAVMLSLVGLTGLGQGTSPCTIYVQPGKSIQAAIDSAAEGAVICLAPGSYPERIVIQKDLTLRGTGAPPDAVKITGIEAGESTVLVGNLTRSIEVHIENLSVVTSVPLDSQVKKENENTWYSYGIEISTRAIVYVDGVVISGFSTGLLAHDSPHIFITDSTIMKGKAGIDAWGSSHVTLRQCQVRGNVDEGIGMANSCVVDVSDCDIQNNEFAGVVGIDRCKLTIENTRINYNRWGVFALGNSSIKIDGSAVSNNQRDGLRLAQAVTAEISNTSFTNNGGDGIALFTATCFKDPGRLFFTGKITGTSNTIQNNKVADTCPDLSADVWPQGFIGVANAGSPMEPRPNLYFPNLNIHRMKAVSVSSFEDYFYGATYVQDVVNNGGPGRVFVSVTLKIRGHIVAFASTVFDIGAHETVTLEAALYFDSPVKCDWGVTGYSIPKQVLDWNWHVAQSGDKPEGKITVIRGR